MNRRRAGVALALGLAFALLGCPSKKWSVLFWNDTGHDIEASLCTASTCEKARIHNKSSERRYISLEGGTTARVLVGDTEVGHCGPLRGSPRELVVSVYAKGEGGYVSSCSQGD